jgi:hypothetical protein
MFRQIWHIAFYSALVLAGVLAGTTTGSAETKRLAVLELGGGLDLNVRLLLSDRLRQGGVEALKGTSYEIMTRENLEVLADNMGVDLADCQNDCEVEIGRKLAADIVISGKVTQVDSIFFAALSLHRTDTGALLSTTLVENASQSGMVREFSSAAVRLLRDGLKLSAPASPPATGTSDELTSKDKKPTHAQRQGQRPTRTTSARSNRPRTPLPQEVTESGEIALQTSAAIAPQPEDSAPHWLKHPWLLWGGLGCCLLSLLPVGIRRERVSLNGEAFWAQIRRLLKTKNRERAIKLCSAEPDAVVAQVLKAGLQEFDKSEEDIRRVMSTEAARLDPEFTTILLAGIASNPVLMWGTVGFVSGVLWVKVTASILLCLACRYALIADRPMAEAHHVTVLLQELRVDRASPAVWSVVPRLDWGGGLGLAFLSLPGLICFGFCYRMVSLGLW